MSGKLTPNFGRRRATTFCSDRTIQATRKAAAGLGDRVEDGSIEDAATFGEALLVATPFKAVDDVVWGIGPLSDGKLVIDATVPFGKGDDGTMRRSIPENDTAADSCRI